MAVKIKFSVFKFKTPSTSDMVCMSQVGIRAGLSRKMMSNKEKFLKKYLKMTVLKKKVKKHI
jgi:hypothetical protein